MSLPSDSPVDQNDTGKTAGGRRQDIDWGRFGLSEKSTYEPRRTTEFLYTTEKKEKVRELFEDEGQVYSFLSLKVTYHLMTQFSCTVTQVTPWIFKN